MKRPLLSAIKTGVVGIVGFIVSMILAIWLDHSTGGFSSPGFYFGFLAGLFLTSVALLIVRRKSWRGDVDYDPVGWARSRTERKLHPNRRKWKRIATRILLWVPSALAAVVLFFLPVATHLRHPGSQYLGNYRVPIPWIYVVFSWSRPSENYGQIDVVVNSSRRGRLGMTPFLVPFVWNDQQELSQLSFTSHPNDDPSTLANATTVDFVRSRMSKEHLQILRRDFQLGDTALPCWQFRPEYQGLDWPESAFVWSVVCETPPALHRQFFEAHFYGREQDLGAFYHIIEGIRPVH